MRADAPLTLFGEATGAGGRALASAGLRWFDGRRLLGRGDSLFVPSLRPGRHRIRLTAQQGGRVGAATAVITVSAVKPAFLRLDAPAQLSRTARTLRLGVASTVASTLQVASRRFTVGRSVRTVSIPVRPGASPLRLTLRLRAGSLSTSQVIAVARS